LTLRATKMESGMIELKVGTSRSMDDGRSDSKIRELSMQLVDRNTGHPI